jgi:hypothetical protein
VGPRLMSLAGLLARRHGRAAVQVLVRAAYAWLSDPANEPARRQLVDQLVGWSSRANDTAGRLAGRLAREVERRRVTVPSWERDLMRLRYEIADMPAGAMREAALDAYASQARAGVHLVTAAARPADARRQVLAALGAEIGMVRRERFTPAERRRALDALEAAQEACLNAGVRARIGARARGGVT